MPEALITEHGGYRNLKTFQVAQLIYDVTVRFCDRYIERRSRTHDQMVQAARSGVQNIAEGSQASATSKKTELKLNSVARASLEELRLDYEDFLRHRKLPLWERADPRRQALIDRRCATADEVAVWVREEERRCRLGGLGGHSGPGGQSGQGGAGGAGGLAGQGRSGSGGSGEHGGPSTPSTPSTSSTSSTTSTTSTQSTKPSLAACQEYSANAVLVLLAVACALLDRQLAALAEAFQNEGGFTERLYRVRSEHRRNQS